MDEFELIERCFRDRAIRRPGTVLGIGDDAAVLDPDGLPLIRAWATVPLPTGDEGAATARHVFGAAFIRLAARAARPRWATLALTLEAAAPAQTESFAIAAASLCDACGVELVGGDTTRGPGRATVFASGPEDQRRRRDAPPPSTAGVEARLSLAAVETSAPIIAALVCVCTELASRGAVVLCDAGPNRHVTGASHALGGSRRRSGNAVLRGDADETSPAGTGNSRPAWNPPPKWPRTDAPEIEIPPASHCGTVSRSTSGNRRSRASIPSDFRSMVQPGRHGGGALEILVHTDAAGIEALRAAAGHLSMETRPLAPGD